MGFFAEFNAWLKALLVDYIADTTVRVAAILEPAIVTLGVIYLMIWGYLQLMGQVEEPFVAGTKRICVLALVLGVALKLWTYNELIVDTFFTAPVQLAAAILGAYDPIAIIDTINTRGSDTAELLLAKGNIFDGNFSYYLAGFAVYLIVGLIAIYTLFLLALSRIALSVLLALGPLFVALLLFDSTRRFFEAWLAQLSNYAFITILTVLVAALMLHLLDVSTQKAVELGGDITIADAVRVCLAAGFTILVMRQVMPMAAGLASGLALSTFGVTSAAIGWALGSARRTSGEFVRGLSDRETTRWDSWRRKAGFYTRTGAQQLTRRLRPNQIRARSRP